MIISKFLLDVFQTAKHFQSTKISCTIYSYSVGMTLPDDEFMLKLIYIIIKLPVLLSVGIVYMYVCIVVLYRSL